MGGEGEGRGETRRRGEEKGGGEGEEGTIREEVRRLYQ